MLYSRLAFVDFSLNETQVAAAFAEALELVANRERYSVRKLVGTLLAWEHSVFCSGLCIASIGKPASTSRRAWT